MNKKYVEFVSDNDFLKCVKWVCSAYPEDIDEMDIGKLHRNTMDPFKMIFDIINGEISAEAWINNEGIRQHDKTINNRIGEFHQKLLGKVGGWVDLGVGDTSKVDLKKEDGSVFMELKNKWNTMNADATAKCRDKLEKAAKDNPKAIVYWAYILSQKGDSGESVWKYHGESNPRIKKIWGRKVYELITGDPEALDKVWAALPKAIAEVIKSRHRLTKEDRQKIVEFFGAAFEDSRHSRLQQFFYR